MSFERFSEAEKHDLVAKMRAHGAQPLVYAFVHGKERVSFLQGSENEGVRHYLASRAGDERLRAATDATALFEGDIFYFTCIDTPDALIPLYETFRASECCRCLLQREIYREEYWCEIMPRLATKAHAIKKLKKLLGFERIVSFGDSINDIPMFEISDECYAPENASPEIKALATAMIPSNAGDGVVKWLLEHICI